MNIHESVLPVQLDEHTYVFRLRNNGNLCNFQLCSHPLVTERHAQAMTILTPNMQVDNVYLCVDNNPIVHIPVKNSVKRQETYGLRQIGSVYRSDCVFFRDDYPLHVGHINSNDFTVIVTFCSPPLSVFWLEYDILPVVPSYYGPAVTYNNHVVEYRQGQIILHGV